MQSKHLLLSTDIYINQLRSQVDISKSLGNGSLQNQGVCVSIPMRLRVTFHGDSNC